MPYTLVSATTLGFDLVRLPAGRDVAQVLLTGLAAGPEELARLAAEHPLRGAERGASLPHRGDGARAAWRERARRARELAAGVPGLPTPGAAAPEPATTPLDGAARRLSALLTSLEQGMLGDAAALERLVRTDVLAPPAAAARSALDRREPGLEDVDPDVRSDAADVLADAAIAAYAAGVLPRALRRELTRPFAAATADAPPPRHDLGPQQARLDELLAAVRATGEEGRRRWRAAVDVVRARRRPWSAAQHEACWAAHVSGRTRCAAAAQLLAVQAFADAGLDASDGALGV